MRIRDYVKGVFEGWFYVFGDGGGVSVGVGGIGGVGEVVFTENCDHRISLDSRNPALVFPQFDVFRKETRAQPRGSNEERLKLWLLFRLYAEQDRSAPLHLLPHHQSHLTVSHVDKKKT